MALADRLKERPQITPQCSLGKLLTDLDGAELAALKVMLGTPKQWGWTAPEIYEALRAEGHGIGFKVINQHRGGTCRCSK